MLDLVSFSFYGTCLPPLRRLLISIPLASTTLTLHCLCYVRPWSIQLYGTLVTSAKRFRYVGPLLPKLVAPVMGPYSPPLRGIFIASVSFPYYVKFVVASAMGLWSLRGIFVASGGRLRYMGPRSPRLCKICAAPVGHLRYGILVASATFISTKQV